MKLTPRQKSLKAILAHKNFAKGAYSTNNKKYPHCALGYALRANSCNENEIDDNKLGLIFEERSTICRLNDWGDITGLHKYCQKLLDETYK